MSYYLSALSNAVHSGLVYLNVVSHENEDISPSVEDIYNILEAKNIEGLISLLSDFPYLLDTEIDLEEPRILEFNRNFLKKDLTNVKTLTLLEYIFHLDHNPLMETVIKLRPHLSWMKTFKSKLDLVPSDPIIGERSHASRSKEHHVLIKGADGKYFKTGSTDLYAVYRLVSQHQNKQPPPKRDLSAFRIHLNPGHCFTSVQRSGDISQKPTPPFNGHTYGFYPKEFIGEASSGNTFAIAPTTGVIRYEPDNQLYNKHQLSLRFIKERPYSDVRNNFERLRQDCVKGKCQPYRLLGSNCVDFCQQKFREYVDPSNDHFGQAFTDDQLREANSEKGFIYTDWQSRHEYTRWTTDHSAGLTIPTSVLLVAGYAIYKLTRGLFHLGSKLIGRCHSKPSSDQKPQNLTPSTKLQLHLDENYFSPTMQPTKPLKKAPQQNFIRVDQEGNDIHSQFTTQRKVKNLQSQISSQNYF